MSIGFLNWFADAPGVPDPATTAKVEFHDGTEHTWFRDRANKGIQACSRSLYAFLYNRIKTYLWQMLLWLLRWLLLEQKIDLRSIA